MIWMLAAALAAPPSFALDDHTVHVRLDSDVTWGIGGQMFLGAQLHTSGYVGVWNSRRAAGSFDFGLQLAYGNEPTFLAPWIDPAQVKGSTQRVQALLTAGHTFHMGKRQQVGLGIAWFAGVNYWDSSYSVDYAAEDVHGSAKVTDALAVTGANVTLSYRVSKVAGINLTLLAPMPTASSYAITFGSIGIGPTFYLR